jgi:hypothetical protein
MKVRRRRRSSEEMSASLDAAEEEVSEEVSIVAGVTGNAENDACIDHDAERQR